MLLLKGNQSPPEIIRLVYGMEEALKQLYASSAAELDDPEVSALLAQLAEIEKSHKDRLFGLYQTLESSPVDQQNFESHIDPNILEGGFSADAFKAQHRSAFQTAAGVLNLAMMLEAQAMDLYLRYAENCADIAVKKIFYQTADDEKAHLTTLGALLELKV